MGAYVRVYPADYNWQASTSTSPHEPPVDITRTSFTPSAFYLPWMVSMAWLATGAKNKSEEVRKKTLPKKKLEEHFRWSQMDFVFPSDTARELALATGLYKPESNLPLGMDVYNGRIFITLPKWKPGIPASLAWIPLDSPTKSPPLRPYPSWSWHAPGTCGGMASAFRLTVDECNRLWVIDCGVIDIATGVKTHCPPQILVFDLKTDLLIWRYEIPKEQAPDGALFTNIAVDVVSCEKTFAYVSDVFRYGIIVYDYLQDRSWRVESPYFYPEPLKSKYILDGLTFRWNDGIFSMALSPVERDTRFLYFHAMSSFREFFVETRVLHNETRAVKEQDAYKLVGAPRRREHGHSSGSAMDRNGVLFYNLVTLSAVGCWNSKIGTHDPEAHGIVARNNITLSFPNDLKVDRAKDQRIWVLSNRIHKYLNAKIDPNDYNFRIMTIKTKDAVKGTPCQPGYVLPPIKSRSCDEL